MLRDYYGSGKKDGDGDADAGINTATPKPKSPDGGGGGGLNPNDVSIEKNKKHTGGMIGEIAGFMTNRAGMVSDAYGAFMGNGSFFEMGEKYLSNTKGMQRFKARGEKISDKIENMRNSDNEKTRKRGEALAQAREGLKTGMAVGKEFEKLGGFQELYKGFNEIRDTMFVNGAPQDWKNTAKEMDENKKLKYDRKEHDFTHKDANRQYIIKEMNLEAKAIEKFPHGLDAPTKRAEWIDNKVEKELTKLAQSYLPLGVNDVKLAYTLSQAEKEHGYTPIQAYSNYAKTASNDKAFGMFNFNPQIVNQVNNTTQGSYEKVSDAIPNAKEFWDNGYRNIEHMQNAQLIKDKLQTSVDMAMKLEQVLRDKGKVSYTGSDKNIEAKFKEINEIYKKMNKGK